MLPDLLAWFTSRDQNKRKFPRKRKPYRALYSVAGGAVKRPAMGVDISGGGLCVAAQEQLDPNRELLVEATLETRLIKMRAAIIWSDSASSGGRPAWRYGLRLTGIAADDWDALVRYCADRPMTETNKAAVELAAIQMTDDDAHRLLPKGLLDKMLQMLVLRGRLAPLRPNTLPLVQYLYAGVAPVRGKPMHRFTIQSKVVGKDGDVLYESKFAFADGATEFVILS